MLTYISKKNSKHRRFTTDFYHSTQYTKKQAPSCYLCQQILGEEMYFCFSCSKPACENHTIGSITNVLCINCGKLCSVCKTNVACNKCSTLERAVCLNCDKLLPNSSE